MAPAWAWKSVLAGNVFAENDIVKLETLPHCLQGLKIDNKEVWCQYAANEYYISVNQEENFLVLYGNRFEEEYRRKFDFTVKNSWHMRILAMEGQLEVYIDDILYMQCGIKTQSIISGGVFAFSGCAEFEDMKIYELEN